MADERTHLPKRGEINWRLVLRALRHRNHRLFYGGQGISLIGTWMTRVATGWLVYRLTHSAFLLGLVSFAGQVPILNIRPCSGGLGGPPQPTSRAHRHTNSVHAAVVRLGGSGPRRNHHCGGRNSAESISGRGERFRYASAPGLCRRDGGDARRSAQRDCLELIARQRCPSGWPFGCRLVDRRRRRRLLLPPRWLQLHGRDCIAIRHEPGAVESPRTRQCALGAAGRMGLRPRFSPHLGHPSAALGSEPGRDAVYGPDADFCRQHPAWRCAHVRLPDGGIGCRHRVSARWSAL
jgi:hypothetical protein